MNHTETRTIYINTENNLSHTYEISSDRPVIEQIKEKLRQITRQEHLCIYFISLAGQEITADTTFKKFKTLIDNYSGDFFPTISYATIDSNIISQIYNQILSILLATRETQTFGILPNEVINLIVQCLTQQHGQQYLESKTTATTKMHLFNQVARKATEKAYQVYETLERKRFG